MPTNQNEFELLIAILNRMDRKMDDVLKTQQDHDSRLNTLESERDVKEQLSVARARRWSIAGIVSGIVVGTLTVFNFFHPHS